MGWLGIYDTTIMTDSNNEQPKRACERHIPPPMDPYARYQTPYDRRATDELNPFIEFRRFADRQLSSWFDNWDGFPGLNLSRMFGLSDEMKKMREHSDQMRVDMQKHIEEVMEQRHKMLEEALKEKRQPNEHSHQEQVADSLPAYSKVSTSDKMLPQGWIETTTRDGTRYFIQKETGQAILDMPTWLKSASLYDEYEAMQQAQTDNARAASWRRGFEKCPELKDLKHEVYDEPHEEKPEESARWQRGMRNCPELKKHNDETELAMYEHLDEQDRHESAVEKPNLDYYKSDDHWNEVWEQGLQKCPELQTNHESRRAVEDALVSSDADRQPFRRHRPSPWWWLSTMGHDGKQLRNSTSKDTPEAQISPDWLHEDHTAETDINALVQPTIANLARWYLDTLEGLANMNVEEKAMELDRQYTQLLRETTIDDSINETKSDNQVIDRNAVSSLVHNATSKESRDVPSVISTMTTTQTRTLPDGSVETKRVLKRRFADGSEEKEESHDVSQPKQQQKMTADKTTSGITPQQGWFWH